MTSNGSSYLDRLINESSLIVCLGPGGVGKTTLSAVLALRAALKDEALVLTIDPARRLADALGLEELHNDPCPVESLKNILDGGLLSALMLDTTQTFDQLICHLVQDESKREKLYQNHFYQNLSRTLSGTLEYMAVERLYALTQMKRYQRIVLDTPPTTNALNFIEAPNRLSAFFSHKITRWLVPSNSSSWRAKLFDRAGAQFSSLLGKVGGEEFMKDTLGFFSTFKDLFTDFGKRGEEINRLLRANSTRYIVISSPDPQRLAEAEEIDQRLKESGINVSAFIVNGVDKPFLPADEDATDLFQRASKLLNENKRPRAEDFIKKLETMRSRKNSKADQHQKAIDKLKLYAKDRPVLTAPAIPAGNSPRAALLAIYVNLFTDKQLAKAS